jgi:hypothetical protein
MHLIIYWFLGYTWDSFPDAMLSHLNKGIFKVNHTKLHSDCMQVKVNSCKARLCLQKQWYYGTLLFIAEQVGIDRFWEKENPFILLNA